MKKSLATFVTPLVLVMAVTTAATGAEIGIITAGKGGTYYQFGLDVQALMRHRGISITVHPSRGSIDNVYAVYGRPGVQLGIVQSDVLTFVARKQSDPLLRRVAEKLKVVFPLYDEEVHLLGRADLSSFEDLAGRRVAIGREGSGTYLTARLLLNISRVTPRETLAIDTDEALAQLKAGRIDAMFYVAGHPVRLFDEGVTEADRLALIPILNKIILESYPQAKIPAATYRWQPAAVDTVAVKSVLISSDSRRGDCDTVGKFAQIVAANLTWLIANGHPKWKSVDLAYPLEGWDQSDCVRQYLGQSEHAQASGQPDTATQVLEAIRRTLSD